MKIGSVYDVVSQGRHFRVRVQCLEIEEKKVRRSVEYQCFLFTLPASRVLYIFCTFQKVLSVIGRTSYPSIVALGDLELSHYSLHLSVVELSHVHQHSQTTETETQTEREGEF